MDKSIVHIAFFGGETLVQSWGTLLGKSFYFRARGKCWSFEVGEEEYLHGDVNNLDYYIEEEYGNGPL